MMERWRGLWRRCRLLHLFIYQKIIKYHKLWIKHNMLACCSYKLWATPNTNRVCTVGCLVNLILYSILSITFGEKRNSCSRMVMMGVLAMLLVVIEVFWFIDLVVCNGFFDFWRRGKSPGQNFICTGEPEGCCQVYDGIEQIWQVLLKKTQWQERRLSSASPVNIKSSTSNELRAFVNKKEEIIEKSTIKSFRVLSSVNEILLSDCS